MIPNTLLGLDFSSAPSKRKPLTLAWGRRVGQIIQLDRVDELPTLAALQALLEPEPDQRHPLLASGFVVGCDFPFGLPRPFVQALQQHGPGQLPAALQNLDDPQHGFAIDQLVHALHHHCGDRAGFQRLIDGWGDSWHPARPQGSKLLHRRTDRAMPGLSSTSPLQTRYVPVGKMYFEGVIRLVQAQLTLPGLRDGRPDAVAFESYPGLLASELIGKRSYKSETNATQARLVARMDLVDALEQGRTRLGLRLKLSPAQRDQLAADAKGDRLDAVLCLMQVGWAHVRRAQGDLSWGLPADVDPVEGWILSA